jgi:Carboxypeptidase regulatory-like domain
MKIVGVMSGIAMSVIGCGSGAAKGAPSAVGGIAHIHGTFVLYAGPVPVCTSPPAGGCHGYSAPIAAALITVTNSVGTGAWRTFTNADGVFDVEVTAGTYEVTAPQQSEPGTYRATVAVRAGQTGNVTLQISEP